MPADQNELQRIVDEARELMVATQYPRAQQMIEEALAKWSNSLTPSQLFYLRGLRCHCLYFEGEFEAAERELITLIQERERGGCFDLSYLNDVKTLGFAKRGLCAFDESERLLKAVRSQLEQNPAVPDVDKLLSEIDREIAMTQGVARGERTPVEFAPVRVEMAGPFGIQKVGVGPLEIPPSQLSLSCTVRKFVVAFGGPHAATLKLEFELDNAEELRSWEEDRRGGPPVVFLLMLPRFGLVHHGRFVLHVNDNPALRQEVVLENQSLVLVHPSSYQPYSRHPIPRCRSFRYAKGDCSTFRAPIPPHARIRFEGEVSFPSTPEETGEHTLPEIVHTFWLLLPYGKVDLPAPTVGVENGDLSLASTTLSSAAFMEDRTTFRAGTYTIDAGATSEPVTAPPVSVQPRGLFSRRILMKEVEFFRVESVLRPSHPVIASFAPSPDVLPLGMFRDIPDLRVRNASVPSQAGTLNLSNEYAQRSFARVLIENFSAEEKSLRLSVRADDIGVAIEQDIVIPPSVKRLVSLTTNIQAKLDSWNPLQDESHPIQGSSLNVVLTGPRTTVHRLRAPVRVLPPDYAVWTVSETSKGDLLDLRMLIAKWVTPAAPSIARVLEKSRARPTGDMIQDLKSVYEYLQSLDIQYDMSRIDVGAEMEYRFQRVRPPFVSLASRRMNCIDGTVLFASCAEALGYRSAIMFVPRHAFVAFLGEGPLNALKSMVCLETTLVCSDAKRGPVLYSSALASGREQFEKHRAYFFPAEGAPTYYAQGLKAHRIIPIEVAREHKLFPSSEHIG